jgi:hypothetical protein
MLKQRCNNVAKRILVFSRIKSNKKNGCFDQHKYNNITIAKCNNVAKTSMAKCNNVARR